MSITAKYPGTCTQCGHAIRVGQQIEWRKGAGSHHIACSAYPSSAPEPGAHEISGRRTGRQDRRYEVGGTVHAAKVGLVGGGPDGHYYTVLATQISPPCEDLGQYDWTERAWVRAATDAEAAPVAARIAIRETRVALARDLAHAPSERVTTAMPSSSAVLVPQDGTKLCATGEMVALVDDAILYQRVGDPDQTDGWYHYVVRITDASLVERVAAYLAAER